MPIPPPISLDTGWTQTSAPESGVCRSRTFDVPPILDVCLSFELHLRAPRGVTIRINGSLLGETDGGPFARDITDLITLEDNLIELEWTGADGVFGAMEVRAVPCGT